MEYKTQDLVKIAVASNQLPPFLYKYRNQGEATDKIFTDSTLWFGSPTTFNDPFDCQIAINTDNNYEEIFAWFTNASPATPLEEAERLARMLTDNPERWSGLLNDTLQNVFEQSGVCCFGQNNTNLLMWSHYCNSHYGYCLKFDILKDVSLFENFLYVNYDDVYPTYNHAKDNSNLIHSLVRTKSKIWEYEAEIRVLKPMRFGAHKFDKSALVEVTFGCRCSAEEITRIQKLVLDNGFPNVSFTQTKVSKEAFHLDIVSV